MTSNEEVEVVLPEGFCFSPTDQELITYLRNKVDGKPLPMHAPIADKILYGEKQPSPWELFRGRKISEVKERNDIYVFTVVKKKFGSGSGRNMERKVATGTWRIQNNKHPVEDDLSKSRIGHMKTFNYIDGGSKGKEKKPGLIMHEYSLNQYPEHETEHWVICRIRMGRVSDRSSISIASSSHDSTSTTPKRKRSSDDKDDHNKKRTKPLSDETLSAATCCHQGVLLLQKKPHDDNVPVDDNDEEFLKQLENDLAVEDDDHCMEDFTRPLEDDLVADDDEDCMKGSAEDLDLLCAAVMTSTEPTAQISADASSIHTIAGTDSNQQQQPRELVEQATEYELALDIPWSFTNKLASIVGDNDLDSHGWNNCMSMNCGSMGSGNQTEISAVLDMLLPPIEESRSRSNYQQPQPEYQMFTEYLLAQKYTYSLDEIWDD